MVSNPQQHTGAFFRPEASAGPSRRQRRATAGADLRPMLALATIAASYMLPVGIKRSVVFRKRLKLFAYLTGFAPVTFWNRNSNAVGATIRQRQFLFVRQKRSFWRLPIG